MHILDNEKKYLNLTRKNLKKYFDKKNLPFTYYSQCNMVLFNNQLATEFNNLPMINPDFIYLDGPDQFNIKNKYACFIQKNFQQKINLLNISDKNKFSLNDNHFLPYCPLPFFCSSAIIIPLL